MTADERLPKAAQFCAFCCLVDNRGPERHEDGWVTSRGEAQKSPKGMERAVGVTRPRASSLWLGSMHDGLHAPLAESENLGGCLQDHSHLVVVLPGG